MRKILMVMAVLVISCSVGWADMMTFVTPGGSTDSSGDPVSAQAVVTTGSGTVTIALSNLQNNFKDAGQLLSDFSVTLSDGTLSGVVPSSTGNLITVARGGAITSAGTGDSGWGYSSTGQTLSLEGLGGTNTPSHLVIGLACTDGTYCDVNPSVGGNGPHNPVYTNPLTFTLDVSGATGATTASNAVFSFGTAAGDDVPGIPGTTPTPEPASLMLFGSGLLGLGFLVRRKFARPE